MSTVGIVLTVVGSVALLVTCVTAWACCVAAGEADRLTERMHRDRMRLIGRTSYRTQKAAGKQPSRLPA